MTWISTNVHQCQWPFRLVKWSKVQNKESPVWSLDIDDQTVYTFAVSPWVSRNFWTGWGLRKWHHGKSSENRRTIAGSKSRYKMGYHNMLTKISKRFWTDTVKEGAVIFLKNDKTMWCKTFWWPFIGLGTIWSNLRCHFRWPHRVQIFLLTQGVLSIFIIKNHVGGIL